MSRAKCLVFGCPNHRDAGVFVGELCAPCHIMLTTGTVPAQGKTFVHTLHAGWVRKNELLFQIRQQLEKLE